MFRHFGAVWANVYLGFVVSALLFALLISPLFFVKDQLTQDLLSIGTYFQDLQSQMAQNALNLQNMPKFPQLEGGWMFILFSFAAWVCALFFDNWVQGFVRELVHEGKSLFSRMLRRVGINFLKRIVIGVINVVILSVSILLIGIILFLGLEHGLVSETGGNLLAFAMIGFLYFFFLYLVHVKIFLYAEGKGVFTSYLGAWKIYKMKLDTVGKNLLQTIGSLFLLFGLIGAPILLLGILFSNQTTYVDLIVLFLFLPFIVVLSQLYFYVGYKSEIRPVLEEQGSIKTPQTQSKGGDVSLNIGEQGSIKIPQTADTPGNNSSFGERVKPTGKEERIIPEGKVICPACGALVKEGKFCGQCGSPLQTGVAR